MGALDSTRTDRSGGYSYTISKPDTAAQYVVGVQHAGVGYLTRAVGPGRFPSQVLDTISVYDTSSAQPITISQRHLLVQPFNPDGSIPVLELWVIRNDGNRTRVAADSAQPTWRGALLQGATDAEIGESDFPHESFAHGGDSIAVLTPITPGDKQIVVTYLLPRGTSKLRLPVHEPIGTLGIMLADTLARVDAGPLTAYGVNRFENVPYLRLEAKGLPAGSPISVSFSPPPAQPGDFWWVIVAVAALGLVAGFAAWWRSERARAGLSDAEVFALEIAALDQRPADPGDTQRMILRAELSKRLAAALAESNTPP
jgi:hypothetical protein